MKFICAYFVYNLMISFVLYLGFEFNTHFLNEIKLETPRNENMCSVVRN